MAGRYEQLDDDLPLCGTCFGEVSSSAAESCCGETFHRGGCLIAHRDEMTRREQEHKEAQE